MSTTTAYWQRTNRKVLGIVAVASFITLQAAHVNYEVVGQKAAQQKTALAELKRWKSEYEALLPIQTKWNNSLPSVSNIKDKYSLFDAIRLKEYGLSSDREKLDIKKIDSIASNGVALNATRICVNSAGESGLTVTAPHFSELLTGLDELTHRRDIEVSNITLAVANGAPKAVVNMCLVFRT
ncbi:MAG: hypothetical protein BGO63_15255 [Candidatus Accumulibacter sp. 66-26]|nr:hypothetical protein [Accumulibacter sp.]OJW52264.1 MAG: hypothetical protein BGO63_15255 [Candidatus Accumulibacter sp. 66-26]